MTRTPRLEPRHRWVLTRHGKPYGLLRGLSALDRPVSLALAVGFWWRAVAVEPLPSWVLNLHGYLAVFSIIGACIACIGFGGMWHRNNQRHKRYRKAVSARLPGVAAKEYGEIVGDFGATGWLPYVFYFLGCVISLALFLGMLAAEWPVLGMFYGAVAFTAKVFIWQRAAECHKWLAELDELQILSGELMLLPVGERLTIDELPPGTEFQTMLEVAEQIDEYRESRRQVDSPEPTDPVRSDAELAQITRQADAQLAAFDASFDRQMEQFDRQMEQTMSALDQDMARIAGDFDRVLQGGAAPRGFRIEVRPRTPQTPRTPRTPAPPPGARPAQPPAPPSSSPTPSPAPRPADRRRQIELDD